MDCGLWTVDLNVLALALWMVSQLPLSRLSSTVPVCMYTRRHLFISSLLFTSLHLSDIRNSLRFLSLSSLSSCRTQNKSYKKSKHKHTYTHHNNSILAPVRLYLEGSPAALLWVDITQQRTFNAFFPSVCLCLFLSVDH